MKKYIIALAATLGLSVAASAPAMAGGSLYVSGSWSVPTYIYSAPNYYTPSYVAPTYYTPAPIYRAPVVAPYVWRPPVISFSFGKSYSWHNGYRKAQRADRRADRRARRAKRAN